jgi:hypothetical protein
MFDPEFYVGAWRAADGTWATCKYSDSARGVESSEEQVVWERRVFHVIPVPGEAEWAISVAGGAALPAAGPGQRSAEKRCRDSASASDDVSMDTGTTATDEMHTPGVSTGQAAHGAAAGDSKKPRAGDAAPQAAADASALRGLGAPGSHILLKVYGSQAQDIKLNEVLDCVCVLSVAPEAATFGPSDADFCEEEEAHNPPHSAVPRLHAVLVARAPPPGLTGLTLSPSLAAEPRAACVRLLTAACGGDALAGEYLLLHLVSRVHSRPDPFAVGCLSLNLQLPRGTSDGDATSLVNALWPLISALVPRTVALQLTVDGLNARPLAPHKCYVTNTLVHAPLQLAHGTHLLVDETSLAPGQLDAVGVRNIQALRDVISCQKCDVDFQFYSTTLPTDAPALTCSRSTSLLPADVTITVRCTCQPSCPPPQQLADHAALAPLRAYLAAAKHAPHAIDADVAAHVEADLVASRAVDATLGQADFHRWLTIARLLATSAGQTALSTATWTRARELEAAAVQRRRSEP